MEQEYIIEMKQVSKKLGKFVLEPMDVKLPEGYIIGLIGQNGAGKTTLLHLLLGLYRPDGGEIRMFGETYDNGEISIKNQIGAVLQERLFMENDSLLSNADYYGAYYQKYDREKFLSYLEEFGLSPEKKYRKLSRGEELKFQFAFALSHQPKLLILDEATGNFDPEFREKFWKILKEFISDGKRSVILATHLTAELEQMADYIMYLEKGKLLFAYDIETMRERFRIAVAEKYKLKLLPENKVIHMEESPLGCRALIRYRRHYDYDKEVTLLVPTIEEMMYYITKREGGREFQYFL